MWDWKAFNVVDTSSSTFLPSTAVATVAICVLRLSPMPRRKVRPSRISFVFWSTTRNSTSVFHTERCDLSNITVIEGRRVKEAVKWIGPVFLLLMAAKRETYALRLTTSKLLALLSISGKTYMDKALS